MLDHASARAEIRRSYATVLLLDASEGIAGTLIAPLLSSRGQPLNEIGFLVGAYAITSLLSRVPAGRIANGRHPRLWYFGAAALCTVIVLLYPLLEAAWAFLLLRLAHGLVYGAATSLNLAAFLGVARGRSRVQATAMFMAATSAGFTLGNFASGLLADNFGYGTAYLVSALCLAATLLCAPRARPAAALEGRGRSGLSWWKLLGRADVRAIPLLAIGIFVIHSTLNTLFPLYVLALGQTLSIVGISRGFQSLSNTLIRPFGAPLLRLARGAVGLASLGIVLYALTVACVPLITAPLLFVPLFILIGLGRGCAVVANALTTSELSERGVVDRGTASTLLSIGQDLALVLGPMVAGLMAAQIGIGPTMQLLPLGAAAFGVLVMLQSRR
jgi:MFS family permease